MRPEATRRGPTRPDATLTRDPRKHPHATLKLFLLSSLRARVSVRLQRHAACTHDPCYKTASLSARMTKPEHPQGSPGCGRPRDAERRGGGGRACGTGGIPACGAGAEAWETSGRSAPRRDMPQSERPRSQLPLAVCFRWLALGELQR